MDDLVDRCPGQVAGVAAGHRAELVGVDEHHAAGEQTVPVDVGDVDRVALTELPDTSTTPAGSRLVGRSTSARRAPSSTTTVPDDLRGEGDPQLARGEAPGVWLERGAPCRPLHGTDQHVGRDARAMTVRTPDHDAIRAAASLLAIPPLPRPLPPVPARMASSGSSAALEHQLGGRIRARIGGEEAVECR
jgi:hypothetical protein